MTTPNSLITGQTIRAASAVCTAANSNYSAPTAVVKLCDAGANGSLLRKLSAIARATVAATQLQLYRYDGTNYYLVTTALMSLYTMAQTTADTPTDFGFADDNTFYLPAGSSLYVAIGVALAGGIVFNAGLADL